MTIETKYNIGDEVWAIRDNRPSMYKITKVTLVCDDIDLNISYKTRCCKYFFESELFPTKEELLKSL